MVVTSDTCSFEWCHVELSSDVWRTVEDFSEESDDLKAAKRGIMKRSVVSLIPTQWVTVLLQGEVPHYLKVTVLSCHMQLSCSLTVQVRWVAGTLFD